MLYNFFLRAEVRVTLSQKNFLRERDQWADFRSRTCMDWNSSALNIFREVVYVFRGPLFAILIRGLPHSHFTRFKSKMAAHNLLSRTLRPQRETNPWFHTTYSVQYAKREETVHSREERISRCGRRIHALIIGLAN